MGVFGQKSGGIWSKLKCVKKYENNILIYKRKI